MLATETESKRLPDWLKRPPGKGDRVKTVKGVLRKNALHTVCEEARCPNLGECFEKRQATFLILGENCTRNCGFCSISNAPPRQLDPDEPSRVAEAAKKMGLNYVVVTSVTRDDLPDGGARHFAETIGEIKKIRDGIYVEVLTPDFGGDLNAVDRVCKAAPEVYNHNIETVPDLYSKVRPQADYTGSLTLINYVKKHFPHITTKSGLMLGLGEKKRDILKTLEDLKEAGCDLVTIGQYMRPTKKNLPVVEYIHPDLFDELERAGKKMGFTGIYAGPLIRSSFNAEYFNKEVTVGRILQN
ncbi:MAG: lipoyl synthase [Proteobacteria bacterium]|nr:lipoyl synthase [Pseudomonadota bacterium]